MNSRSVALRALPAVFGLLLTLSGCQSVSTVAESAVEATTETIQQRELKLRQVTNFQFAGGLGIWSETQSIPARIRWVQSGGDLNLSFSGPLGLGELQLQDKSDFVSLLRGKTVVTSGSSVDDVVQRGLGLTTPVPVEELKQWVRGLPGAGDAIVRDSAGRLSSLQYFDQSGVRWRVRFKRYGRVDDLLLPTLISASGGDYSVRLLLKNWKLTTILSGSGVNEPNKRLSIPGR
ncbi:MAG: outer membrane lipoprotein LolB [Granulosicoccus sp.]|jgi:outer membrane lipoprotein LolB